MTINDCIPVYCPECGYEWCSHDFCEPCPSCGLIPGACEEGR